MANTFLFVVLALCMAIGQAALVAKHQLVHVETAGEKVIRLTHHDTSDAASVSPTELTFTIKSLPSDGDLYQLSSVYSKYGYEPKLGSKITAVGTVLTGSDHRLVYRRPSPDTAGPSAWATFTFEVNNGLTTSLEATVTLVPSTGILKGSDFLLGNEGWTVVGNKMPSSKATFEALSRGQHLNHYIVSHDDKINVPSTDASDMSLWYFNAPSKFVGDMGIAYGGSIDFTVAAFSGNFASESKNSDANTAVLRLTCDDCVGPVGPGITLIYPLASVTSSFSGEATALSIPLEERRGWLKDPQNTLVPHIPASQCDIIQVLYRLTSMQILGDWTNRHESVALDNVNVVNTGVSRVPVCAMTRSDASICDC